MSLIAVIADPHFDSWARWAVDPLTATGLDIHISHPILRWGARAHTSVLFQIAPNHSWARTWNRFYSLADYTPETLFSFQADGKIPPAVELIRFDNRLH